MDVFVMWAGWVSEVGEVGEVGCGVYGMCGWLVGEGLALAGAVRPR